MRNEKSVNCAVFGLTFHGRQLVRKSILNDTKIDAIVDNDPLKSGQKFCNVPILSLDQALKNGIENFLLVGRYAAQHELQLLQAGVASASIHHVPRSEIALSEAHLKIRNDITLSFLQTVSKVCASLSCEIWLDSSGLLAAVRGEALGSLSDVDLLLTKGPITELISRLQTERGDWQVKTNSPKTNKMEDTQIVISSSELTNENLEPACLDIRGAHLNPKLLIDNDLMQTHFQKSDLYFKPTIIKYPWSYEAYLKILYGEDWKTPDEYYQV